ncbi:MAG TPA: hypothetical protein VLE73_02715 [Candidatus Saccharimonadales bacterium]|nr:hypothetical protein [Candidatus Saccharimonadales bacterium]
MDEDTITDLKQFIASTVSQHTSGMRDSIIGELRSDIAKLDSKIDNVEEKLEKKIDDLSTYVADALDTGNEEMAKKLDDHEHRIVRLEKRVA